jgi:hypothetical protein
MIETKLSAERNAAEMGVPAFDASGKGEIAT